MMNCGKCIYGQETGNEVCKNCVGSNYKPKSTLAVDVVKNKLEGMERFLLSYTQLNGYPNKFTDKEMQLISTMLREVRGLMFDVDNIRNYVKED